MNAPKILNVLSRYLPLSLLFLTISSVNLSSAANFISHNQSLTGTQKLISEGGNFELGFFQPGNSPYYYIGIWFSLNKVSHLTSVWVANRVTPITDPATAKLKISADGNLVLSNHSNPQVWSTNTTIASNFTVAVLLDSGNLVLRDGSNPSRTLWQSFDHPTDTLLPGAKIGLNKLTGDLQSLTSWKNQDDPAPGMFSFHIDPNGTDQYFLLWNHSYIYWTSGIWNGQFFTMIPEMTIMTDYNIEHVSNPTENYFAYTVKSTFPLISRTILGSSGLIEQLAWVENSNSWMIFWVRPKQQCDVHALCGAFGSCNDSASTSCNCMKGFREESPSDWALGCWAGGCVRNTPLQCGNNSSAHSEKDQFYMMSNMRLPDNAQNLHAGTTWDCELGCLKNCSCTAYSYGTSGCSVWYGDLLNLQDQYGGSDGGNIFVRVAASELSSPTSKKGVFIGAVIAGVAGSLGLLVIAWVLIWQRRRKGVSGESKVVEGVLSVFRYEDLQRATNNFSEKLGQGGFGSVFKGILPDSTEIAVKKLEGLQQGEKQFRSEVSTIGMVQHVNLIRLLGFCSEKNQKLLVYENMPSGSLDNHLFQKNPSNVLDWKTRYQIAFGIARGMAYLHEQCRDCIIHCDIKPENILLDASFVPKVADFGLAKLVGRDFSRVLTTLRGTLGYLAPEWISGVAITAKADVYSYGMMLFEIISGKRNSDQRQGSEFQFFPSFAVRKLLDGDVISSLDDRIISDANLEEVSRACMVASWCIQDDEKCRPTMGQVAQILEGTLEVNMPPIPKIVRILTGQSGNVVFSPEFSAFSSCQTHTTFATAETRSLV